MTPAMKAIFLVLCGFSVWGGCTSAAVESGKDAAVAASGGSGSGGSQAQTGGRTGSGGDGSGGTANSGGTNGTGGAATGGASTGGAAGEAAIDGGTTDTAGSGGAGGRGMPGGNGGAGGGSGGTSLDGGIAASGGRLGTGGAAGGGGSTGGAGGTAVYSPCPLLPAACKILPFGDSITDGVGASGGGYRIELFRLALLDGKKITFVGTAAPNGPATVDGVAFPRQHEGHSGYTIDNQPAMGTITARAGISPLVPTVMNATKPDIVTLMIGTNDIQHSLVTNAPERLARLIDSIIAADAHTLIVVAQIVPTTDATVNMAIQTYNAAIPALVRARAAAGKHVVLVDMYQVIAGDPGFRITGRTVPNPAIGPMNDWLHPNAAGYKLMGAAWYGALKSALR